MDVNFEPPPVPPREDSQYTFVPMTHNQSTGYDAWEDTKYFEEYAKLAIHCDMLRDKARMNSYYSAITKNIADFKDKVVLDVGCGSGILSCWAARAGAKKVYAIEASSVAEQAELIVARNGLSSIVEVIQGKVEEILLPERVDVIISEWMGSFLVFESMLEAVIFARDNWLKPGGKMYPALANIYVAPINMEKFINKKVSFLKDVEGVDMSPLGYFAKQELGNWVIRGQKVKPENVIGNTVKVQEIDTSTVTVESLKKIASSFEFVLNKKDATIHGFAAWFDVIFTANQDGGAEVVLTTSPDSLLTHWRHDVFLLKESITVVGEAKLNGLVRFTQNNFWKRHYDIEFSFEINGKEYYTKLGS